MTTVTLPHPFVDHSLRERVMATLYGAIDEFNAFQPPERQLEKAPETVLLGSQARLDSLGLVSLLITVEQRIASDFGVAATIASEKAFSLRNSPFATVNSLGTYITELLKETNCLAA